MQKYLFPLIFLCICFLTVGCGNSSPKDTLGSDVKIVKEATALTTEQAGNIVKILGDCGIKDIKQFKNEPTLNNVMGEGVQAYRVNTNAVKEATIYQRNGDVVYIGCFLGGEVRELYSKNTVQAKVSDYLITDDEFSELIIRCKRGIESMLKSPKTAEFAGLDEWRMSKDKEKIIVQAYVDSQNSFGALIRSKFQITFSPDRQNVTSLIFDGKEYIK